MENRLPYNCTVCLGEVQETDLVENSADMVACSEVCAETVQTVWSDLRPLWQDVVEMAIALDYVFSVARGTNQMHRAARWLALTARRGDQLNQDVMSSERQSANSTIVSSEALVAVNLMRSTFKEMDPKLYDRLEAVLQPRQQVISAIIDKYPIYVSGRRFSGADAMDYVFCLLLSHVDALESLDDYLEEFIDFPSIAIVQNPVEGRIVGYRNRSNSPTPAQSSETRVKAKVLDKMMRDDLIQTVGEIAGDRHNTLDQKVDGSEFSKKSDSPSASSKLRRFLRKWLGV